jgi:hypothetical protein
MSRAWTEQENTYLVANFADTTNAKLALDLNRSEGGISARASKSGLVKSVQHQEKVRKNQAKTQFKTGHTTWNKGQKFVAGGRSIETRFKPGQKPKNHHPIGHERITRDGNTQRKLTDTGCTRKDYVNISHIVWIAENGAIPAGHIIRHKDGNNQNCELSNLQCISKADNMRLNSYHNYPAPIPQLIQLRSALNRQLNNRSKS